MKQILIQVLSALVGNNEKIQIKKPNINFKEGLRRIVLVLIAIWVFFDVWDIVINQSRSNVEIFMAFGGGLIAYFCYLCLIKILCWIGAGFSGKKNKRTLFKELQIRYKYWNRQSQRNYERYEKNPKELIEKENQIEYNRNPFIPKGRMKRFDYIIYSFLCNFIMEIVEYDINLHSEKVSLCAVFLWLMLVLVDVFISRNRIYDITLSNKKAWLFSILIQLIALVLGLINPVLIYVMLPIGVALMVIPSNTTKDKEIKKVIKTKKSAFDVMKEMHKADIE